jgi:protein-S-isoprenylcysteine O-methyltransferase Ste14
MMTEPILFRFLLAVQLLAFVAHRAYYNRKFPPPEESTINRLEKTATSTIASFLSIVALASTLIYIVAPNLLVRLSAPFPVLIRWLGVGVALAGFALLEWSHRTLAANWSDQPRITQTQGLVQTGPYQRIRHPIYTSFLMILGSTLLISTNWLVGLSWIVSVSLDAVDRIRYEERALYERFGQEYEVYRSKTGSLLPKI